MAGLTSKVSLDQPNSGSEKSTMPRDQLKGMRILLTEDSVDNQILFLHLLRMASATVELANDGAEALEKIKTFPCDMILMDIQMPNLDGYEATKRLRAYGFSKAIIALTAHAHDSELQKMLASGFDARIVKPIQAEHFAEEILVLMERIRIGSLNSPI